MNTEIKRKQELTLKVDGLAFGGKGFTKYNNFIIFIDRGIPGQKVRVRIHKKKEKYAEAKILDVLEESPWAVPPACEHFGLNSCGGCLLQNLDYSRQIAFKQQQVEECLHHIGGFHNLTVEEILPSDPIYFYRNKMEYSFCDRPWYPNRDRIPLNRPDFALGLHVPGSFNRVINVEQCHLLSPLSNQILKLVKKFTQNSGIKVYNTRDHHGFWRHLVFREAKNTQQMMVNIVTSNQPENIPIIDELSRQLQQNFPQITTFVHNINHKKAQIAVGDEERILFGPGKIIEQLGQFRFAISANSFFQTNTRQAARLYDLICEFAQLQGHETVYDLYCGTGTISLYISPFAVKVIGYELVPEAIRDARENSRLNGIENCKFIQGDLKDELVRNSQSASPLPSPEVLITDPPRAGMHADVVQQILTLQPQRIVYVSCNPSTFARDLRLLCESKYKLIKVKPVDMFPHTAHCEAVGLLKRID